MASRILNRRELRRQADQQEPLAAASADVAANVAPPKGGAKRKANATGKVAKPRKSKEPPRLRAVWCIFDGGMKEVALFDYNQRAAAEEKLAALQGKQKGVYFLQIVKQLMPQAEPVLAPPVA